MAKRFVICSPQKEYANLLAEHISERQDLSFQLFVCNDYEGLTGELKKKHIDILLIDGAIPPEKRNKIKAKQIYVLTRAGEKVCVREKEIYQFQSANAIISEILEGCIEQNEDAVFKQCKSGNKQLIGVYSPIHRIGKSEFTLALAHELDRRGKVLYVSLEEYSPLGQSLFHEKRNLADILYYMKQDDSYLGARVGTVVRKFHGIDVIAPIPVSPDLKEVLREDWEKLFLRLMKESMYEWVIVDFSESVQGLPEILNICNVIYQPTIKELPEQAKLNQYRQVLKQLGLESITAKTVEVAMEEELAKSIRTIIARINPEGLK